VINLGCVRSILRGIGIDPTALARIDPTIAGMIDPKKQWLCDYGSSTKMERVQENETGEKRLKSDLIRLLGFDKMEKSESSSFEIGERCKKRRVVHKSWDSKLGFFVAGGLFDLFTRWL
jgi:hypothetical protein